MALPTTILGSANAPKINQYHSFFVLQQRGAGSHVLPVFAGSKRVQSGAGFGDILRSIFRFVLPVAARGAAAFLDNTAKNYQQGISLGEAAKSSIRPTLGKLASGAAEQLQTQAGHGRKRKRLFKGRKNEGKRCKSSKQQHGGCSGKSCKLNF